LTTMSGPLNTRGRRDAPRMGELVREYGLIPDVVISSDAVPGAADGRGGGRGGSLWGAGSGWTRVCIWPARPTSSRLLRTVGKKSETVDDRGHNPGSEELVAQLTGAWQTCRPPRSRRLSCRSISGANSHCRPEGRSWATGGRSN